MANPNPQQPITGVANPNQYPAWGVKQISGTPGYGTSTSDYSVEKASNAAQKAALLANGYDVWFGTQIDANNFVGSQVSNAKNPVTQGANAAAGAVTGWTHNIEQWLIRGFEMLLGLGLIIVSVAKLASDTPAGKAATKIATKVALA
jgi:hypothetical protein